MSKFVKFINVAIFSAFVLSACNGGPGVSDTDSSSTSDSSSEDRQQAAFNVTSTSNGASVQYERGDNAYYYGDLVNFKIVLREGFLFNSVRWNNKLLSETPDVEYPFSFAAVLSNTIKIILDTNFEISGVITFDGNDLSEAEATSIGIQASDDSGEVKDGVITYSNAKANYVISNVAAETSYTVKIIGYTANEEGGPFEYHNVRANVVDGSVVKNIDVITAVVREDKTITFPKATGQIYAYENAGGLMISDYTVEIKMTSKLSELTANASKSVSSVFQLNGLTEGSTISNRSLSHFRIIYQDTKDSNPDGSTTTPSATRIYRMQSCSDGAWKIFDLSEHFTTEAIESEDNEIAVLISFTPTEFAVYFSVNKQYVKCLSFNCAWRQNVKYIDTNAWASSSECNTTVTSCKAYGSVSSPDGLEGYGPK